jgi:hypothetical protein
MEYDCGEEECGRTGGEEYLERQWDDGVQENGEAGEVAEGAQQGDEVVWVG